jgi:putative ABC transport system permease protein
MPERPVCWPSQIGARRALGATRLDILRYFMFENGLLTTGGVLLGTVLAFGLNR